MKVKVIKKKEIAAPVAEDRPVIRDARESAREMVATVSDWVTEFKARKSAETKAAVESLLGTNRAPNES